MTTDQKINSLKPGQSIAISDPSAYGQLMAERSGNGKTLTMFRQFSDGSFKVVSTQKF